MTFLPQVPNYEFEALKKINVDLIYGSNQMANVFENFKNWCFLKLSCILM